MDERPYRKRGISEEEGHMDICQYRGRDIGSRELLAGGGGGVLRSGLQVT